MGHANVMPTSLFRARAAVRRYYPLLNIPGDELSAALLRKSLSVYASTFMLTEAV